MTTDFFAMPDERLLSDEYGTDLSLSTAQYLGTLDQYELKALENFWELGIPHGTPHHNANHFRIPAATVKTILAQLRTYQMPDNQWHHELKAKLLEIFENAAAINLGLLGF